jgi:unsaturated rhamnogalacturonyl hydrolase
VIAGWVKGGGTLILFTNDAGNADLKHMNILAGKFGVRFNEDNFNTVKNDQYEQGAVLVGDNNLVFKTAKKVYIKELATLEVSKPANTILAKDGKNVMALARYGKGSVLILGDPWLYNEYVDGRKLPLEYENFKAARDLVEWIAAQKKK